jgi:hypothetical protein
VQKLTILKLFPFLIVVIWSCTKLECPPQLPPSSSTDSTRDTISITLQGVQLVHSEVHSIAPTTNYSTGGRLAVWTITNNNITDTARSFLKFDYSSLPSGITIISATLTLYADSSQVEVGQPGYTVISGPNNWLIETVGSSWEPTTITWDNAPGPVDTTLISPIHVPSSGVSSFMTYSIDLISLVKKEINNPATNYGIVMRLVTESKWRGLAFYSPILQTGGLQTNLTIEYQK